MGLMKDSIQQPSTSHELAQCRTAHRQELSRLGGGGDPVRADPEADCSPLQGQRAHCGQMAGPVSPARCGQGCSFAPPAGVIAIPRPPGGTGGRGLGPARMRLPGFQIAKYGSLSRATVSRILTRYGLAKLFDLDPPPAAICYQREHPGDLLHIDIKKLGRIVRLGHRATGDKRDQFPSTGWEFVHLAINDASRMAYAKIMPNEKIASATEFLRQALAHFASFGIRVRQLMSDNGSAHRSQLVAAFLQKLRIEHIFTRRYTPRSNGNAEHFIQTSLREWAYAAVYQNSAHRQQHLQPWIHRYNWHRPHAALKVGTAIHSLNLPVNNVLRFHS